LESEEGCVGMGIGVIYNKQLLGNEITKFTNNKHNANRIRSSITKTGFILAFVHIDYKHLQ